MAENQLNLPPVDEAIANLDRLYIDAFFNKMAEYGFVPETHEAAEAMLATAYKIDMLSQDPQVKQALAENDAFVAADRDLDALLYGESEKQASGYFDRTPDTAIKQAALALAENADLYKSALSVIVAQADGGE